MAASSTRTPAGGSNYGRRLAIGIPELIIVIWFMGDFGFAGHSSGGFSYYKSKATGGAPKEMSTDHFFVTKLLDSELHGMNSITGLCLEMQGLFLPWSYDIANIKCPCFLYIEPKGEVPITHAQLNNRLIPGSELIVFPEHGHCSIMMEFEKVVLGLIKGNSVQSSFH